MAMYVVSLPVLDYLKGCHGGHGVIISFSVIQGLEPCVFQLVYYQVFVRYQRLPFFLHSPPISKSRRLKFILLFCFYFFYDHVFELVCGPTLVAVFLVVHVGPFLLGQRRP